jgi:hypothetical protein
MSNAEHSNQLIEIIGGTVIIGPEYTRLQQVLMVDYYYTCTATITLFIGFLYYAIIYSTLFRKQQRPSHWNSHDAYSNNSYPHHWSDFHANNDYDDVHNFDYMDDLHINEEENDDTNKDDSSDWEPVNNDANHGSSQPFTATDRLRLRQHFGKSTCHNQYPPTNDFIDDDDDDALFFDTIPLVPDNDQQQNDNVHTLTFIDDNSLPIDESGRATNVTIPTVNTTNTSSIQIVQNETIDSSTIVSIEDAHTITTQMVAPQSNHTSRMKGTATSSIVLPFNRAVRPCNDFTDTDEAMMNDSNIVPDQPQQCVINENGSPNHNKDDGLNADVQYSPEHHPEPEIDTPSRITYTTEDVGATTVVQLLLSELKNRKRAAAAAIASAVERNDPKVLDGAINSNRSNRNNQQQRANGVDMMDHTTSENYDRMYQEYPFLAFLNW